MAHTCIRAMAMGAIGSVGRLATLQITWLCACGSGVLKAIRRQRHIRERLWARPSVLHPVNYDVNLCVGQAPAKAIREGRHRRAWHALCDNLPQGVVAHQRLIEWITEWPRRPQLPVAPMAPGTGAAVALIEVADLGREERPLRFCRLPRYAITAEHQATGHQT